MSEIQQVNVRNTPDSHSKGPQAMYYCHQPKPQPPLADAQVG